MAEAMQREEEGFKQAEQLLKQAITGNPEFRNSRTSSASFA